LFKGANRIAAEGDEELRIKIEVRCEPIRRTLASSDTRWAAIAVSATASRLSAS